jgi:hypothetical protein
MNVNAENCQPEGPETTTQTVTLTMQAWMAWRKAAGRQVDPETAEVSWWYALTVDPYEVHSDLPEECRQVGRQYFARSPDTDVWICFGDLPDHDREALWNKHKSKLGFPAGLESLFSRRDSQ